MKNPIVLMYHGVVTEECPSPVRREPGADLYDVTRGRFYEQLGWIRDNHYSVSLYDEKFFADTGGARPVVLTFDDGELNNFQNAFPLLAKFRFPAYFFVTVNRIGKKDYMTWEHLKQLRDGGMVIGSHGLNHRVLTDLKKKDMEDELYESKAILEKNLLADVDSFSVPRGFCSVAVIQAAGEAGYRNIFTSQSGNQDLVMGIPRIPVKKNWNLSRFCLTLEGKTPVTEKVFQKVCGQGKALLGSQTYDHIRTFLLRWFKK